MILEVFQEPDFLNSTETEVYIFPASFGQKRLWFLDQLEPGSPFYNLPFAIRLSGDLNLVVLEQSFQIIIERHEALRTILTTVEGEPVQAIAPHVKLTISVVNLQNLPEDEREIQAQKLATEEARCPFVLSEFPLLRLKLIRLGEQEHILLLTIHHAIFDGWSIGILLKELAAIYTNLCNGQPAALPDLPLQYADYSVWQQEWLHKEVLKKQLAYWKQQLNGISTLELPTDRPRSALQTFEGKTYTWQISPDLTTALETFSQKSGVTLFMTLLTAFNALLYRYTGQDDIVVGSAIANRNWAESEGIIGLFVNTLALRTQINDNPSFSELLTQVRDMTLAAYAHQDLPFEKLVEELQPERDLSRNPLFQVWFALHNLPIPTLQLGDLTLTPIEVERGTTQFDLSLHIYISEQGLTGAIEYSTELFKSATITHMVEHFHTLLYGIVANPQAKVSELPLLTSSEKHQLLIEWNDTQINWKQNLYVHQLIELQVQTTPDAIAIVFEQQQLTYQELNQRSNQIAHYLQKLGVKPDVLVGICVERSLEMVVGLLGIIKAGGAYVPLDPDYPTQRLAFMLEDAQVPILLTQQSLISYLPKHHAQVICLDTDWQQISSYESTKNPYSPLQNTNLAYVIYTSGSTGQPKGAMNTHQGICNRLLWMQDTYKLTVADRVLQKTPFSFDVSVWEFFWTLITGACLVMAQPGGHRDSSYLLKLIQQQQITILHFVPSMLQVFLNEAGLEQCQHLKLVICSGEALPFELQEKFFAHCQNVELHNLYGPTEAAIDVTFWQCQQSTQEKVVPIGRPIANTQIYLLDQQLQPVPIGVPGELHIGGVGLARGYLNRPQLTNEKFIPNPFSNQPGARLYKTGDLARYLSNGEIEYLGRIDHQVKLRGFRIELQEVEAVLACYSEVQETAVVVREDEPGKKRLVAYIVPVRKSTVSTSKLRQFVKDKLPNYMVPSVFVILDALPLTPNGKLDRRSLPVPDTNRPELEETFVAAQNTVEAKLVQILSEVLGVKYVGIYDNFFELGGDSILSIQVVAQANQQGLQLTPKQIFQHQTIAELATVVGSNEAIQAQQGLVTGNVPLTPIQHWFFAQNFPQPDHYNQANLLIVPADINSELLPQVIHELLIHHDVLRSQFTNTDSGWQQVNTQPNTEIPFVQIDLSTFSTKEQQSEITLIAEQLQSSLNLATGSLVKVALFNLGKNQPIRLLFVIHHLLVDGVSWRILLEDFQTAYNQLSYKRTIQLPAKTTSYQYWAKSLLTYAQSSQLESELDYWLRQFPEKNTCLPVDFPQGINSVKSSAQICDSLDEAETKTLLHDLPSAYRTQINEILLTALAQTFTNWTKNNTLLVDLEGHGREPIFADIDLSRTVGWFTSIFPVCLNFGETNDIIQELKLVKEQLRQIPNQGIGYGLLRYLGREEIAQKLAKLPRPEVIFNYLGQFNQISQQSEFLTLASESIGSEQSPQATRSYLLEINCFVVNNKLQIEWNYSQELYHSSTIQNLAQGFVEALRSLINHCQSADAGSYIPSDFSSAKIGQKDFNKLLAKLKPNSGN
jgi:amino acid adenylation domain-containing protein/non-ribosomal peptide synthase protein (TIGR01720 family)